MVLSNTAVLYYEVRHPTAFVNHLGFQTRKDLPAFHMHPFYYYRYRTVQDMSWPCYSAIFRSWKIFEYAQTGNRCLNHKAQNVCVCVYIYIYIYIKFFKKVRTPDCFYCKWFNMLFFLVVYYFLNVQCLIISMYVCLFALMSLTY
jgi:hypothetical protein